MQDRIHQILTKEFSPHYLRIDNDSHLHAGPKQNSHFKILLVSDTFTNLSLVKRHQKVYQVLKEIMQEIHALQLNTWTNDEWQKKIDAGEIDIPSSQCAKS